jgi:hypothetical protein
MVQWTISSDERPERKRRAGFGMFFVLALLGSLGFASRPKSAVADLVEQGF